MSCCTLRSRRVCWEGCWGAGVGGGAGNAGAVAWGCAAGDFAGCDGPQPPSKRAVATQPTQQYRMKLMSIRTAIVPAALRPCGCNERPYADDKLCHGGSPRRARHYGAKTALDDSEWTLASYVISPSSPTSTMASRRSLTASW